MSDKSWEPEHSLTHSVTLSLPLSLTISLSLTLSLSHPHTLDMLNNFCFHVYAQKSHSHTLTLSHSRTLALLHSCTLALLHTLILSFTLSRHAEKLLFSCLCSKVTLSLSHSLTLSLSLDMLNNF